MGERKILIAAPVIVGALGNITKKLEKLLGKLDVTLNKALLQKKMLLGTVMTLRKVLEY